MLNFNEMSLPMFVIVFVLIYLYLTRNFNYWKHRGINGPKPVPLLGNFGYVFSEPIHDLLVKLANQYGKLVGLLIVSWITAKRQIIHDRTAQKSSWNLSYDYIVVGAGTAGCVIANRLAENQQATVLLLEAGGALDAIWNDIPGEFTLVIARRPDLQWTYFNEPQKNAGKQFTLGRIPEPKGRVIGGSSSHNAMIYVRGNKRGYDEWQEKYGAKGWSNNGVLPYFKKWENNTDANIVRNNPGYHWTKGPVQITTPTDPGQGLLTLNRTLNDMGFESIDVNGMNQAGYMIGQSFIKSNGFRSDSGSSYVDPNPYPQNLHIVTNALVYKVLFNGTTAVGVMFSRMDTPHTVYARREVILSAGAINTPQLLLLSGVGPKDHLETFKIPVLLDLPVGNNYKNHPIVIISSPPAVPLSLNNLEQLYMKRNGPLSQNPIIFVYFSTKNNQDKQWPNAKLSALSNPINSSTISELIAEVLRVRSKGTIRLQSNNPYIPPVITTNFLSDPRDLMDAIDVTKFMIYMTQRSELSNIMPAFSFESVGCQSCPGVRDYDCISGIVCYIKYSANTYWHPGGSCRMGAIERSDVVVDPLCRVKFTQNLRVCDSSIFPDLPNANTNAAALMVGEKCADLIQRK